jgi:hypothetical protein
MHYRVRFRNVHSPINPLEVEWKETNSRFSQPGVSTATFLADTNSFPAAYLWE